jgi:hypothetical protein
VRACERSRSIPGLARAVASASDLVEADFMAM